MKQGAPSFWSRIFGSSPGAGTTEDARAFLQQRVALFLSFEGTLMGAFYLIDAGDVAIERGPGALMQPGLVMHLVLVIFLFGGWRFVRHGEPSERVLGVVEGAATLGLCTLAIAVTRTIPAQLVALGPVFAIALTLVARAAIVPSSGRRTFLLGLLATLMATVAYAQRVDSTGSSLAGFAGVWTFAFTAAAALVSRVIYGLQRRVQEAARLGQYILESKLGEGGMGTVYRARHAMLRRPTAIKLLLPSRAGAENVARFEREVQQTARLSHPNTVTIYDYGRTPDGVFYYAMELLDGADLDEVVELDGAQSVARAVHIVSCVAGALSEAHEAGLIHRDIKPANIMLCQQGGVLDVAKVVDFGLVKQLGEAGMTQANTLQGTPLYMAPEAITSPEELDARADLYALGAVTYYLITGRHVFEGESVLAVCTQHLSATPDPPSAHAKQPIPEGLERLVLQCLEKDPNERPASAAEVQASLLSLDIPVWDARAAKAWWNEHGDALRSKRRAPTEEVKRTVAVDLAARG